MASGVSYDAFLKAYGATVNKSFFPYEYFNSLDKLDSREFPSYVSFYSSLKSKNTLEPSKDEILTEEECNMISRIPSQENPLTNEEILVIGSHRYASLQQMFYENQWTFRDFLIFYNNRDVQPFLAALDNLTRYYVDRGVDIFKEAISGFTFTCVC